jgi:hypothetical protein
MRCGDLVAEIQSRLRTALTGKLVAYETSVGLKYRGARFDSRLFSEHVVDALPLSGCPGGFSRLLMPPDLLRNQFTLCGKPIIESPHFGLMQAIEAGTLAEDVEYARRMRKGTLDARPPARTRLERLAESYRQCKDDLAANHVLEILVIRMIWRGESAYVIADGKHRAAVAAALNKPESVSLQVISRDFALHPFFEFLYGRVLDLKSADYTINQDMIKEIVDGR